MRHRGDPDILPPPVPRTDYKIGEVLKVRFLEYLSDNEECGQPQKKIMTKKIAVTGIYPHFVEGTEISTGRHICMQYGYLRDNLIKEREDGKRSRKEHK